MNFYSHIQERVQRVVAFIWGWGAWFAAIAVAHYYPLRYLWFACIAFAGISMCFPRPRLVVLTDGTRDLIDDSLGVPLMRLAMICAGVAFGTWIARF